MILIKSFRDNSPEGSSFSTLCRYINMQLASSHEDISGTTCNLRKADMTMQWPSPNAGKHEGELRPSGRKRQVEDAVRGSQMVWRRKVMVGGQYFVVGLESLKD
jgi:hypothetical protein